MDKQHTVVWHNNYDSRVEVLIFNNLIKAHNYIEKEWKKAYDKELAMKDSKIDSSSSWKEPGFAQVTRTDGTKEQWAYKLANVIGA